MDRARRIGRRVVAAWACVTAWAAWSPATTIVLQPPPGSYESVIFDSTQNMAMKLQDGDLTHDIIITTGGVNDVIQENALLQFNLGSVGVTHVTSAELTLYQAGNSAPGAVFDVFQNTSSWSSSTVTWSTRPTYNATPLSAVTLAAGTGTFYTFDVTAAVNSWLAGTAPDDGFTIMRIDEPNSVAIFAAGPNSAGSSSFPSADWPALTLTTASVPEPASLVLLTAGLAAALAIARRRELGIRATQKRSPRSLSADVLLTLPP